MTTTQNPFTPMLLTFNPARVYGRKNEITSILQVITSPEPNSHAIYGIRTIGKTTLLKYLKDKNGAPHQYEDFVGVDYRPGGRRQLLFVYLNFHRFEDGDRLFHIMLEQLRADSEDQELAQDIHIPHIDDTLPRQDIVDTIRSVLEQFNERDIRVVFLLDEFETPLKFVDYDHDRLLRTLSNHSSLIIATESPISKIRPDFDASSPLLGILRPESIGLMTENASRQLISEPLQDTGIEFSQEEQDFLMAIAGRQPFLLTAACELYFDLKIEYPDVGNMLHNEQDRQNLENQFRSRLEELPHINNLLIRMWNMLNEREQTALYNMTRPKGMKATSNIRSGTARLANKSLAYLDLGHSVYRVFSLLFANFVRRQYMERQHSTMAYTNQTLEKLTPIDRSLFEYLLQHTNQICTFKELRETVWGDSEKSKRALEAAVHRLRKILGEGDQIKSIRGKGYKFVPGNDTIDKP